MMIIFSQWISFPHLKHAESTMSSFNPKSPALFFCLFFIVWFHLCFFFFLLRFHWPVTLYQFQVYDIMIQNLSSWFYDPVEKGLKKLRSYQVNPLAHNLLKFRVWVICAVGISTCTVDVTFRKVLFDCTAQFHGGVSASGRKKQIKLDIFHSQLNQLIIEWRALKGNLIRKTHKTDLGDIHQNSSACTGRWHRGLSESTCNPFAQRCPL